MNVSKTNIAIKEIVKAWRAMGKSMDDFNESMKMERVDRKCKYYQSEENSVYQDIVRWVCTDCDFKGPLADNIKEAALLWDSLQRR